MEIKTYKTPRVDVIEVKIQNVLCGSLDGNRSMNEVNFGDGGFEEQ